MRTLTPALAALLLAGCAPQNATLTSGEYYAYLSDLTSFSLQKGTVDPVEDYPEEDLTTIDCREFENNAEKNVLQLPGAKTRICDTWGDLNVDGNLEPPFETWMGQSPWWIVHEAELNAWRGEAIITGEGDLQIGFHHRLPGGADARFAFVLDPDFAPQRCNPETAEPEPVDGDWVANWSKDLKDLKGVKGLEHMEPYLDNGQLFYLNGGSFQLNPAETVEFWTFPEQYEAGFAAGKFAEEDHRSRSPRYGTNDLYEFFEVYDPYEGSFSAPDVSSLYFCDLEAGDDPETDGCMDSQSEELVEYMAGITDNYKDTNVDWAVAVHENRWRTPDGEDSGLDGWMGLHYNFVVIEGDIEVGEPIKGAFTLVLDGEDSNSRFLYRGEFDVPRVKKDKWVTADIRADKLEENGNSLCVLN